jgi:hypothetical protein
MAEETSLPQQPPAAQRPPSAREPMRLTDEEFARVMRYVLLGIVLRVLDHDVRAIDASPAKMRRVYRTLLLAVQDRVLLDMAALRRSFREAGIKIYEERRDQTGVTARFACRGYHHRVSLLWPFIRARAEELLRDYLRPGSERADEPQTRDAPPGRLFNNLSNVRKSSPRGARNG